PLPRSKFLCQKAMFEEVPISIATRSSKLFITLSLSYREFPIDELTCPGTIASINFRFYFVLMRFDLSISIFIK
ncbi:MAG: hypothetical protein PHN55_05450, partial [Dysgonamonadaceae bacterium]|nr:hypothetical protein [Dysgonamonadaceae bacterium]